MTLNICWLSKTSSGEALSLITDSRLRGSMIFNECTKVFPMPRQDCLLSFAGSTEIAYTFMNQARNAIETYDQSQTRYQDIAELKGHLLNVMEHLAEHILLDTEDEPSGLEDVEIILAGYSWKQSKFLVWRLRSQIRDKPKHKIRNRKANGNGFFYPDSLACKFVADRQYFTKNHIVITGTKDEASAITKQLMRIRSEKKLKEWGKLPFVILRDTLLKAPITSTSGGPLQFMRVFKHAATETNAVLWPNDQGIWLPTISGRFLLAIENFNTPLFDPRICRVISVPYRQNSVNNSRSFYEMQQELYSPEWVNVLNKFKQTIINIIEIRS